MKPMFFDPALFPALGILRDNFHAIRAEGKRLYYALDRSQNIVRKQHEWDDPETCKDFLQLLEQTENRAWFRAWGDAGWLNYPIMYYDTVLPGGTRELCPHTVSLLESIGGIRIAGFSLLAEHSEISPHTDSTGLTNGALAYHLGLYGHAVLHVNDETATQAPGKVIIFDSENVHSVQNGPHPRLILYIDFDVTKHAICAPKIP